MVAPGVRKLPVAAVVSTVVHVAVGVAWLSREVAIDRLRISAVTAPALATAPTLEVELFVMPPEATQASIDANVPPVRSWPRTRGASRSAAAAPVAITIATAQDPVPDGAPPTDRPPTTVLSMRGGAPRSELPTLPQGMVDDVLAVPTTLVPDLPGARLDVEIAALQSRLRNAKYVMNATPEQTAGDRIELVALRSARRNVELVRQRDGSYVTTKDRFVARVDPDGKVHLRDTPNLEVYFYGLGIAGRFDATDWAMRSQGMDPYASQKLEYLDRTRDQRFAIGQEHRRAQLAQSGPLMQSTIDRLWSSTRDLAARKRGLFELWDDCAETGNADLVAGGAAARRLVINFIQAKLVGADAFTPAELAQLNAARNSKLRFAPYE